MRIGIESKSFFQSMELFYFRIETIICFHFHRADVENVTKDSISIHGLFLEAAHWNEKFIDEQILHKPVETFPVIHIKVKNICRNELLIFLKNGELLFPAN